MQDSRTLDDVTSQPCHSQRSEESRFETLRFTQGDTQVCQSHGVWFSAEGGKNEEHAEKGRG
jgi:hypothetical protein